MNFYRYAKNNPAKLSDPFGLNPAATLPWLGPIIGPIVKPILGPIVDVITGIGAAGAGVIIGIVELVNAPPTAIDDARAIPKPKPCEKSGRQSKCSIQSVGNGYCVYQCDDGTTVIDTSCEPYFYKDWGARH